MIAGALAFVRSGYVSISNSSLYAAGSIGYNWSHTSDSSIEAYRLSLDSTDIYPLFSSHRFNGFPLRCLYPGSA